MKRLLSFCKNAVVASISVITILSVNSSCTDRPLLPKSTWEPRTYEVLEELIETSKGKPDAYAVFDFDNTTVVNDVSFTSMVWQIENLAFALDADGLYSVITATIPDLDVAFTSDEITARELAEDIRDDYRVISAYRNDLDTLHKLPEYLDFRAKFWAYYKGVENTLDYGTGSLWVPSLYAGMTYERLDSVVKAAVASWTPADGVWTEEWASPDGKVSVMVEKGLVLPEKSVGLYNALRDNGIDVYVVSASLEEIVEAIACNPASGLNQDADHIFGLRFLRQDPLAPVHPSDTVQPAYVSGYDQPYMEGKVQCIKKLIAPRHGGADPVLVAGDSNGDFNMLTEFPGLKVGLIFNCGAGGKIAGLRAEALADSSSVALKDRTEPRYVVEKR